MNSQIEKIENHYQEFYFNNYQKKVGEFGGLANKWKFQKHITKNDVVLDFGCGGGYGLKYLECKEKIGVEINPVAREFCNTVNNIKCVESLNLIPDESIDIIISNHCLEHTTNPYEHISEMFKKLKKGGKVVLVIPLDSYRYKWVPNDINNHLYSFSPMNLGNLLNGAGFVEIKTKPLYHHWVPKYEMVYKIVGLNLFHLICNIYGIVSHPLRRWIQVKGVATK